MKSEYESAEQSKHYQAVTGQVLGLHGEPLFEELPIFAQNHLLELERKKLEEIRQGIRPAIS